jgi:hypothetical protein
VRTACVARGVYGVPLVCGRWRPAPCSGQGGGATRSEQGVCVLDQPVYLGALSPPFQTSSTDICSAIPNRAHQVFRRRSHFGRCVFSSRFGPKLQVDQRSSREPQVALGAHRTRELCTAVFQSHAFPILPKETSHLLSKSLLPLTPKPVTPNFVKPSSPRRATY